MSDNYLPLFRVLQAAIGRRNSLKPGSILHTRLSKDITAVSALLETMRPGKPGPDGNTKWYEPGPDERKH